MALVQYSLLVVAGLLLGWILLASGSVAVKRSLARVGLWLFDRFESSAQRRLRRQRNLRSAHLPTTYREYAAETAFKSVAAGVAGGIGGVYALWGAFRVLSTPQAVARTYLPEAFKELSGLFGIDPPTGLALFGAFAGAALAAGVGTALAVYYYRWYYPRYVADERARQIDMSLPMTVSFLYALSRSGMSFPDMMRTLADHDHVYGHTAEEIGVAVRHVEVFGMDVVSAVKTMSRRSPSAKFREFSENLSSVLQTGGSLSEFLHREYQEFRQEAETQQSRLLELIETLAEAYVTLGVAGPLFLIVILTITGIAVGNSLPIIRLIVYAVIPLGNLAFIVYLSTVVDNLSPRDPTEEEVEVDLKPEGIRRIADLADEGRPGGVRDRRRPAPDGGTDPREDGAADEPPDVPAKAGSGEDADVNETLARLAAYKNYRDVRQRLESPFRTVVHRPTALLWITFPLAVFLIGIRIPGRLADGTLTVAEFDDLVIQSTLFLFGTFAVAYEIHRRRAEAIESSIPDFLERMASLNEAGMTVVDSLERIRTTELGTLDEELDIVWRDIRWGADVETALKRFESRVRTKTVSRIVTLITEAMKASGNIGTVLRIAANQAKADRRLKQRRRQEMLTYVVVVYVSFLVFLFIIGVLNNVLLPNLPDPQTFTNLTNTPSSQGQNQAPPVPGLSGIGSLDEEAYQLTFLHAAVVQGAFSGLIAGQLSTGDLRAGAKHLTILVAIGYLAFVLVL